MTYIDLFAGAGGLSEGFAQQGFIPLGHVEADADACRTLETRLAYHYLSSSGDAGAYTNYLLGTASRTELLDLIPKHLLDNVMHATISGETIDALITRSAASVAAAGVRRLDVLLGAAPCQAYSLIGRSTTRQKKGDDPRLGLYKFYVRFLRELKPTFFIFENVPGILSVKEGRIFADLKSAIREEGYHVDHRIVHAQLHGVLQQRRRVIVFGWRKRLHIDFPQFSQVVCNSTVSEILDDLPTVSPGHDGSKDGYAASRTRYLELMSLRRKEDILSQHIARPHNEADRRIYTQIIRSWSESRRRLRYQHLPRRLRTRSNITSFTDRYKLVAPDLPHSHTVLAHIAKDGHYYIHPDEHQRRSITVREAARLQSFPDSYYFEGSRSSMFRQIGNAVPPLLARAIAGAVRRVIA
jgi:DNA (cytosine-5)-methyltransferase 1